MGIKNVVAKVGSKISNTISKAAVLSPEQLKDIQAKKEAYILEKPNPNDPESIDLTQKLLGACGVEIHNAYLSQIDKVYSPIDANTDLDRKFDIEHNIRYINITKWVTDKNENSLEKLVNVYETLSNDNCNIALIFNRKMNKTDIYLAVVNLDNSDKNNTIEKYKDRILSSIKGNFPGTECNVLTEKGILPCLDNNRKYSVSCVSNSPAEKSEKFSTQTIEKLIDGIVPEKIDDEYTIILLATPVLDIETRKIRMGEYYSGLAPYSTWQTDFTTSESTSNNSMFTLGANIGVSAGVNAGQGTANTNTQGTSHTTSDSTTESNTHTDSNSQSNTVSKGVTKQNIASTAGSAAAGIGGALMGIGGVLSLTGAGSPIGVPLLIAGGIATGLGGTAKAVGDFALGSNNTGESTTNGKTTSDSKTQSKTHTEADTVSQSNANTESRNTGNFASANFGVNFARSSSVTATVGKSEGIHQTYINYSIKHTLEVLEEQMKRLEESTALGMWDFAAYILSENLNVANNVAHSYLSLTQGEKSYLSKASINLWRGDISDDDSASEIVEYLKQLRHPVFGLNPVVTDEYPTFNIYPTTINAATALSGKELAYSLNFPKKSISGLPVIECAEFGRNITTYDDIKASEDNEFNIGKIYHMHSMTNVDCCLSKESLKSHVFITGSTGSGKSNTVYEILNNAIKQNINFLVIEPSKGEYKDIFGGKEDVHVYGTNPELSDLLRINPFSIPNGIHIFEHMDRLVEIFNVCWPMYAAMPAVLKNAIQKSYEDCGWDLVESTNKYGNNLYPTFKDVARNIKSIIELSEYDNENKGAYKGALLTRLESLTNGINGMIFTVDEISLEDLFDKRVVVDISRIGSSETKSLIMGMLVLKLQEYRMSTHVGINEPLKHLTILEEAHNLLKRTSTEQPTEGANLLGKSVEMISNAIAEMRTYGEGFVIVDQAPGLLDMAAIRNTNTKIIMRLPDEMDRNLVGKASNLNDDQIIELAKLPCGVAAIYQNEWIQPVLCKVNRYDIKDSKYEYKRKKEIKNIDKKDLIDIAKYISNAKEKITEPELRDLKEKMQRSFIDASMQAAIIKFLLNPMEKPRMTRLAPLMNALFPEIVKNVKSVYDETHDKKEWTRCAESTLELVDAKLEDQVRRDIIQATMTYFLFTLNNNEPLLKAWLKEGGMR